MTGPIDLGSAPPETALEAAPDAATTRLANALGRPCPGASGRGGRRRAGLSRMVRGLGGVG